MSNASEPLIESATEGMLGPNPIAGFRVRDIAGAFGQMLRAAATSPMSVLEQEAALLGEFLAIASGKSQLSPLAGDKRFGDTAWQKNPAYRSCMQAYLACAAAAAELVDKLDLDETTKARVQFAVSSVSDAAARFRVQESIEYRI